MPRGAEPKQPLTEKQKLQLKQRGDNLRRRQGIGSAKYASFFFRHRHSYPFTRKTYPVLGGRVEPGNEEWDGSNPETGELADWLKGDDSVAVARSPAKPHSHPPLPPHVSPHVPAHTLKPPLQPPRQPHPEQQLQVQPQQQRPLPPPPQPQPQPQPQPVFPEPQPQPQPQPVFPQPFPQPQPVFPQPQPQPQVPFLCPAGSFMAYGPQGEVCLPEGILLPSDHSLFPPRDPQSVAYCPLGELYRPLSNGLFGCIPESIVYADTALPPSPAPGGGEGGGK